MGKIKKTQGFVSDSRGILWRRRDDPLLPYEITNGVYLGGRPHETTHSQPLSINNYVGQFNEEEGDMSTPRRDPVTSDDNYEKREEEGVDIEELTPPQNHKDFAPQMQLEIGKARDEEGPPKAGHQELLQPPSPPSQVQRELDDPELEEIITSKALEIPCSVAKFGKEVVVLESDEDGSMSLRVGRKQIHLKAFIPRFYDTLHGVTDESFDLTLPLTTVSTLNVTSNEERTVLNFQLTSNGGRELKNSTNLALGTNYKEAEFTLVPKYPIPKELFSKWTKILQRKIRFVDSGETLSRTNVTIGYTVDSVYLGKYCFTGRASIGLLKGTIALHMRKSSSQRDLPLRVLFPKDSPIKYYLTTHERNGEIHPLLFISLKSEIFIGVFENELKIQDLGDHFNPESSVKKIKYMVLLINAVPNLEKQLADIRIALGSSCSTPKSDKLNLMLYYIRQNLKRVAVAAEDLSDEAPTNIITPKRSLEDSDGSISSSTSSAPKAIKLETNEDVKTRFEKPNGLQTGIKIALAKPEDTKTVQEEPRKLKSVVDQLPLIENDLDVPLKVKSDKGILEEIKNKQEIRAKVKPVVEALPELQPAVVEHLPLVKHDLEPMPLKVKSDKVDPEKFKSLEEIGSEVKSSQEIRFECFSVKAGDYLVCGIHFVTSPGFIEAIFSPRGLLLKTNAPKFKNKITKKIGQRDSFEIPMDSILEVLIHPIVSNNFIFLGLSKEEGDRLRNKFQLKGSTFSFNPEEDLVYGSAKLKYFKIYPRLNSGIGKVLAEFRTLFGWDRVKLIDDHEAEYLKGNSIINPFNPQLKFYCSAIHFGTLKYTNESFFRFELDKYEKCTFKMSILDSKAQNIITFEPGYDATFELGHWTAEDGSPHLILAINTRSSEFPLVLERGLKVDSLAHHYDPRSRLWGTGEEERNLIMVVKIDEEVTRMVARIKGLLRKRCVDISGDEKGRGCKRVSKLREIIKGS